MLSTMRSSNWMSSFSARDLARDAQPEPVAELHDVRLVHGRDLLAAVVAGVVEGELEDRRVPVTEIGLIEMPASRLRSAASPPAHPGDQLLGVRRALLVLDAGVEIFGVLAHDDQVDVVGSGSARRVALASGATCGVQVELLAQRDVDRAEAAADRGRDRALERDPGLADRVEDVGRERVAAVASITSAPASRTSQSNSTPVASSTRRVASVSSGPVAVARDENHSVCHAGDLAERSSGCVGRFPAVTLAEARPRADELAVGGSEQELADLRAQWDDELEARRAARTSASARSPSARSGSSAGARRRSCSAAGSTTGARPAAARRSSRSSCCRATTRAASTAFDRSCT